MVALAEAPAGDAERADAMYAESYVLFAGLFASDPARLGAFFGALDDGAGDHAGDERRLELFTARFGDPAEVERRILRRPR